jgi:hypothetical protein
MSPFNMSVLTGTVRGSCAHGARWVGAFAIGACIAVCADGGAVAQTSGKIPEFVSNPSTWGWVRLSVCPRRY